MTAFTEAVETPEPCFITFTVGTHGVENVPIGSSDARRRAALSKKHLNDYGICS